MLIIYDTINTIFFVILAYLFIDIFLTNKRFTGKRILPILLLWSIAEIGVVNIFSNILLIRAVLSIALTTIFSFCLYKDKKIKIIILSAIQYFLLACFDFFAYFIGVYLVGYIHIYEINESILLIYGGVLSQLIYLIAIIFLMFIFSNKDYKDMHPIEILKYSVFPILSISLLFAFSYFNNGRELSDKEIQFYIYFSICFLVANLYMFWLLKVDVDNKMLIESTQIRNEYAHELSSMYEQIMVEHKEISSIEHEYKNNLSVINSLLLAKKYDELERYLANNKLTTAYTNVVDTGNAIVTAIINAKYSESSRKGIQVRFDLNSLAGLKVQDTDMMIILSNLLNNAIESCDKVVGKSKIITIKINYINNLLFICVTNTVPSETKTVIVSNGTTKSDKHHHGYGIHNIERIVNNYDGHIETSTENGVFSTRIIIPCENFSTQ